jgi:hypothetical protein
LNRRKRFCRPLRNHSAKWPYGKLRPSGQRRRHALLQGGRRSGNT